MSDYFTILLLSGIIPFILSFYPRLNFYRNLKALLLSLGSVAFIFGIWDVLAAARGHWHFNPEAVWPLRIVNLPLEEVLFFVVIPFCCIFTWEAINYLKNRIR